MPETVSTPSVLLPTLPQAAPLDEAVLFGFDEWAFPFRNQVQVHLITGQNPRVVLHHGPQGSHDQVLLYYGTVIRIGDIFHMWYNGNHGPIASINYVRKIFHICYATSTDGVNWEKPDLGLVEYNGSKRNNIVAFDEPGLWSTGAVLYDPEDPDPNRRFKMAYEAGENKLFCVAFIGDGLRWTLSAANPVGPFLEMTGVTKHRGLYYVNGQSAARAHSLNSARRLVTFVSADFEHWSPCSALGLDRAPDVTGPSTEDVRNQFEEVHLGAGLWNRGNVILGLYGQWHGHFSGERRLVIMDLGLAVSHDALHFYEPVPGFRIVPAMEQPGSPPMSAHPALQQGQGMENLGDQTLYWYSLWRGTEGSGVRLVTWPRDRLGMLKPFASSGPQNISAPSGPQTISCPVQALGAPVRVHVNASGLGQYSRLRIALLDEGFRPIPGYSGQEAAVVSEDGFRAPVRWAGGDAVLPTHGLVRLDVRFEGVRPEDCRLHAVYVVSL